MQNYLNLKPLFRCTCSTFTRPIKCRLLNCLSSAIFNERETWIIPMADHRATGWCNLTWHAHWEELEQLTCKSRVFPTHVWSASVRQCLNEHLLSDSSVSIDLRHLECRICSALDISSRSGSSSSPRSSSTSSMLKPSLIIQVTERSMNNGYGPLR